MNFILPIKSLVTRMKFPIGLAVRSAAVRFTDFVTKHITVYRHGKLPKESIIRSLECLAFARLNSQHVQLLNDTQLAVNTVGVPHWFENFVLLMPKMKIFQMAMVLIEFRVSNITLDKMEHYVEKHLWEDLSLIKQWTLQNGQKLSHFEIAGEGNKQVECKVFLDPLYVAKNKITYFFPSSSGYTPSLTWLFGLLFMPTIVCGTAKDAEIYTNQFSRFVGSNYYATIDTGTFNQMLLHVLLWYFNGHTVFTTKPDERTPSPRSPKTGAAPKEAKQQKQDATKQKVEVKKEKEQTTQVFTPPESPSDMLFQHINDTLRHLVMKLDSLESRVVLLE